MGAVVGATFVLSCLAAAPAGASGAYGAYGVTLLQVASRTGTPVFDDAALTTINVSPVSRLAGSEIVAVRTQLAFGSTVRIEFVHRGGQWVRVTAMPGDTDYVRTDALSRPMRSTPPKPPYGWRWGTG